MTGEEEDTLSEAEAIFILEADEIDLDNCPPSEVSMPDNLDGPQTGDMIEIGQGAAVEVEIAEDDEPEDDEWDEPLEGTDADYSEVLPFDSLGPDQSSPQIDIRHGQQN
ncbi:hypothetical protein DEA98_22875 [Brucella pseudogrignonensis]|nr:hypothetical protein [Brucella pseudogrignonensis]